MPKERFLDLRTGDVVSGADDHVVGPGRVVEVSVSSAHVDVARDVPAVLNVRPLAVAAKVAAPRGPLDGKPSELPSGHRPSVRILDLGHVTRHGASGAARSDVIAGRGDEDVKHLG